MKPVNQTVWQAANTAERTGRFNRASGGRPTPTGRGPRDTPTYIRHDRDARGPMHGWSWRRPRGPRLHRCMMESQATRSGFTATDCARLEMVFSSFFLSQVVEVKSITSSQLWSVTGVVTRTCWCFMFSDLLVCLSFSFFWQQLNKLNTWNPACKT